MPVSETTKCKHTGFAVARSVAPSASLSTAATVGPPRPGAVNLMALPTRLTTIWRRRPGSPTNELGHLGRDVARQLQSLLVGAHGQDLMSRRGSRAGRSRSSSSSSLPASILEKSRMSLITVKQRLGRLLDQSAGTRAARRSSSVSRASSVMPMMPFMGVRISWLMLARNSLLARLAFSARSRAFSNSMVLCCTRTSRSSLAEMRA